MVPLKVRRQYGNDYSIHCWFKSLWWSSQSRLSSVIYTPYCIFFFLWWQTLLTARLQEFIFPAKKLQRWNCTTMSFVCQSVGLNSLGDSPGMLPHSSHRQQTERKFRANCTCHLRYYFGQTTLITPIERNEVLQFPQETSTAMLKI